MILIKEIFYTYDLTLDRYTVKFADSKLKDETQNQTGKIMTHHKSALKRIRSSEIRRQRNRQNRSQLRTLTKAVRNAEKKEDAEKALARLIPYLDRLASKRIIHPNKAARQKSRLTKKVAAM